MTNKDTPSMTAAAPTTATPAVTKEPWLKWPPDRKVWAGGAAGIITWLILSLLAHFGLDVQAIADSLSPLLGGQHVDVAGTVSFLIMFGVAHYTAPSVRDVVDRVNNAIIRIANADPGNPTTAVVVDQGTSDAAAVRDVSDGLIPAEVAEKTIAANQ